MEKEKKSYNLVIGIVALIVIILLIAIIGYFVSKPKPLMIQGEAEASEYRVSGKVPGRIEELYVKEGQIVRVKVLETDDRGRVKLSMKAVAAEEGTAAAPVQQEQQ